MLKTNLKIIMEELRKFYKVYLPFNASSNCECNKDDRD